MALWRWLRRRSGEVGFRAAVDSLRPHSHALWQSLDTEQQRRFLRHAAVVGRTGHPGATGRTRDPLLRGLLDGGHIRPDRRSRCGERLWALGPLTKGRYWEIVAVPDIRPQAAAVAADLAEELRL